MKPVVKSVVYDVIGRRSGSAAWTPLGIEDKLLFWGRTSEIVDTGETLDSFSGEVVTNNVAYLSPSETLLNDGNTVAWFDGSDLTTITKDAGTGEVSEWRDKLLSVNKVTQDTATKYPIYSSGAIAFDGSNDFLRSNAWELAHPFSIYMVAKLTTVAFKTFIGGLATLHFSLECNNTKLKIYCGAGAVEVALSNNTYRVIICKVNGANSKMRITDTESTGNPGTYHLDGITMGANSTGTNAQACSIKEFICRRIDDSSGDETILYDYLKAKYSL